MYTSLAFNSTGPAISYHNGNTNDLMFAHLGGDGEWHVGTVDSTDIVGTFTSLAFNASGPAISYYDGTNGDLKFAHLDGSGWHAQTLDCEGQVGTYTSLAFNATGPAVSYFDSTNRDLKFAWWEPDPAPKVTSVIPAWGRRGTTVPVTNLAGTGFSEGAKVNLTKAGKTIRGTGTVVVSPSKITCDFPIPATAAIGPWSITVTNPDSRSGTRANAFTVKSQNPPTVTSMTPVSGKRGKTVAITNLAGTGFFAGAKVNLTRAGKSPITGKNVVVVSSKKITCKFTIPVSTAPGKWNVAVRNVDGQTGIRANAFTVLA
jgi:hypothetical protein